MSLSERIEGGEELSAVVGPESGTVLEVGAGGRQRIGHIGKGEVAFGEQVLAEPLGLGAHGRLALGRQEHGPRCGKRLRRRL
jgi:hypothetical protein